MNPQGVSSRNITHRAPRLPASLHPFPPIIPLHHGVRPLYPPTQAIPQPLSAALASRPRNIKPTRPYFSLDSMESPRGDYFLFFEREKRRLYIKLTARSRRMRRLVLDIDLILLTKNDIISDVQDVSCKLSFASKCAM